MASLDDTTNPSGHLIAAHQVQGTAVYNTALEKLGRVEDMMIDKRSGRIAYAILSFGGFLGIGDRRYPLPWEKLSYNTEVGGYIVDISNDVLEGAPSYAGEGSADWNDEAWSHGISSYYGATPMGEVVP
jgi:sporulation protein YlmC with PRC-barrel domain